MRHIILGIALLVCTIACAQTTIHEKLVFHKLDVLETGTEKPLESFENTGGVIIRGKVGEQEHMIISVYEVYDYDLTIVNKVVGEPRDNIKMIMYQGGGNFKGMGIYTANVFFVYDLSKNKETPEFIRLEINDSPNIMKYSGIIKLED